MGLLIEVLSLRGLQSNSVINSAEDKQDQFQDLPCPPHTLELLMITDFLHLIQRIHIRINKIIRIKTTIDFTQVMFEPP